MMAFLSRDLPTELAPLEDLALDLRWTWSHALWKHVDAEASPYLDELRLGAAVK